MNFRDLPDMSAAYKQVQEKKANDGNLANNAPPYDRVTRRDVITGALGKDEMGGKRKKHDCAKKVNYKKEEFDVIPEMHTMLEDGTVTHYDITNGEYIYENVPVEELEILISEKHEHFDNYDKNAEVLGENRRAARAAGGYKDDSKKQPDPSKAGFTGVGNMSIDQIRKMSARIEKEKTKKEEFTAEGVRDEDPEKGTAERKARLEKKRGMKLDDHPQYKKEAFAFSEEDLEELNLYGEEIDAMSDEELIDMMEDLILEMAEDDQDLIEICEHLEGVEMLAEDYYDSAVKASKAAAKKNRPSRMARLKAAAKGAAKKIGAAAKPAAKAAAKGAVRGAGYAVGLAKRAAKSARAEYKAGKERGEKGSGGSSSSSKPASSSSSSSSDDDGTDGKLDSVLSSIRGSKGKSSGGGSSSASSGGGGSKKKSLLRRAAGAVGRGLKKAVGKTARAVSKGSGYLAKKLGEDYDQIADMYESGIFSIQEIENVVELYKGKHGQTAKQDADSRSQGGKMVSGDSKQSGAEYTHGRRVKAANPGMQPDVGGKTKPKSQGKMDAGTRADLQYRKANLKKDK